MNRGLWFVAGASAGVYALTRARRVADSFTADGLRARWHGLTHAARLLSEDVRTAQAERETVLREQLGLPGVQPGATRQLQSSSTPSAPADRPTLLPPHEQKDND